MAHNTHEDFWRAPAVDAGSITVGSDAIPPMAATACPRCGTEFMIGSRFCHACGAHRPQRGLSDQASLAARAYLEQKLAWLQAAKARVAEQNFRVPAWVRYLHFHEIKAWIGLPTASFVAFMIGLGCVVGAIGVGLFYKASNMAEFQAVQLWRIEWLLAATASFVAGILLKKSADGE